MSDKNAAVAVYPSHDLAEAAVKELQRSGFDMKSLSIIGKGDHTEGKVVGYYSTGERIKYWGELGTFWGGFWSLLFGAGFFFVPGLGPLVVAGPIVSLLIGALEGAVAVAGLSALGAALFSAGISRDGARKYETAPKAGNFVLVVHGTAEVARKAKEILDSTKAAMAAVHVG